MSFATRIIFAFFIAGIVSMFADAAPYVDTSLEKARNVPWVDRNVSYLHKIFHSKALVQEFIRDLVQDNPDVAPDPVVTDYAFSDLNGTGYVELVCVFDVSGRGLSRGLLVVSQHNRTFQTAVLGATGLLGSLSGMIINLGGGHRHQILVSTFLEPSNGNRPVPEIEEIYEYTSGVLRNSSRKYATYYKEIALPNDVRKLAMAEEDRRLGSDISRDETTELIAALEEQIAFEKRLAGVK